MAELATTSVFYVGRSESAADRTHRPATGGFIGFPMPPFRVTSPLRILLLAAFPCIGLTAAAQSVAPAAAPANAPAGRAAPADTIEELSFETSDNVQVAAWYYPVPKDASAIGTVILLHDLGGSHRTVEPLAKALQAAGCAVVAPDLRGHGESPLKSLPSGSEDQSKLLKKPDFEMMVATRGGRVRDQSGVRGDVECVRNWIKRQTEAGTLADAPLFVVGSGLGAALAAGWTAADAMWPDLASGPQGREVAGLVMISPAFTTKGYTIAPALTNETVRRTLPLLVIAGRDDRDAAKVFDQLKRQRPKEWFDNRLADDDDKETSPAKPADATLMLLSSQIDSTADALAAHRSSDPRARAGDPASLVAGFMRLTAGPRKK
jgi:alpha-beta hydrolase superfamily lysophospholipase